MPSRQAYRWAPVHSPGYLCSPDLYFLNSRIANGAAEGCPVCYNVLMKTKHPLLIAGNWKMNPTTLGAARELFLDIRNRLGTRARNTDVVVAPPLPFISELEQLAPSKRIELAAQDVSYEKSGAHTGEVSISMLKSVGVSYVILGHSEMRARGESDHDINASTNAVLRAQLSAIVCVGEEERDAHGEYFSFVESQLRAAIADVPKTKLSHLVIAYEPVWAIGTGKTATAEDVEEMKLFIAKVLADHFGRSAAEKIRILYGGSVTKKNARVLLEEGAVDGFLIGGSSLRPAEFVEIVNSAETHGDA